MIVSRLNLDSADLLRPKHIAHFLFQSPSHVLRSVGSHINLRRGKCTSKAELCRYTLDAMGGVDVLDESDLVASGRALAGDDGGVCEEVLPDLLYGQLLGFSLRRELHTLNHLFPYFASTFSLFAIQFLYHLHNVAE